MLARENYSAEHITGLRTRTGADISGCARKAYPQFTPYERGGRSDCCSAG